MSRAQFSILDEIIVDNFAGGGGASTGIELATGRIVDIAINHDPDAILMHETNHPHTEHIQASVWDVKPAEVCRGRPVGLAWYSPDCKHFSKAKGGKPVDKNIRGLSWVVLRWGLDAPPRVIIMENVEEIQTWGPVIAGPDGKQYPDAERKGETFQGFIGMLTTGIPEDHPALAEACEFLKISIDGPEARRLTKGLGYIVEWRELVAADYGAPTTRKRFFMIARKDGQPIAWPEPTHALADSKDVKEGRKKPWRSAAEIIDWSLPTPSIFDDRATIKKRYGLNAQRPLRPNTMRRVIRGVEKFVIKSAEPFLVVVNHSGDFRGQAPAEPLQTVTAKHGYGIVDPLMVPWTVTNTTNSTGHPADEPVDTARTGGGGGQMFLTATMMAIGQTGGGGDRGRRTDQPIHTTVSKAEECMVAPSLIQYHTEKPAERVRGQEVADPIMTIDTNPRYAMTAPALVKYYGNAAHGQKAQEPLHTITTRDREALLAASMTEYHGASIGTKPEDPAPTTLAKEHQGIVAASLSKFYGGAYTGDGSKMSDPLHTVTAIDHNAVSAAHMVKMKGTNLGGPVSEPVQTITAGGGHFGAVVTRVEKAEPGTCLHNWPKIRALLNEFCDYNLADDEVILFEIAGALYFMADIGLRMLTPRELYMANGFPPDYVIDRDHKGNEYGKTKAVARCGNAVPPPFATALVRANLPEWCSVEIITMAQFASMVAV